jgi:hypothetical protein
VVHAHKHYISAGNIVVKTRGPCQDSIAGPGSSQACRAALSEARCQLSAMQHQAQAAEVRRDNTERATTGSDTEYGPTLISPYFILGDTANGSCMPNPSQAQTSKYCAEQFLRSQYDTLPVHLPLGTKWLVFHWESHLLLFLYDNRLLSHWYSKIEI